VLRQVAEGVLIHQSELLQNNAVVVQGRAGVLLIDPGITGDEMACLVLHDFHAFITDRDGETGAPLPFLLDLGGYGTRTARPRISPRFRRESVSWASCSGWRSMTGRILPAAAISSTSRIS
jgi:hypothetical protein